jgi:filamentous hemagglutinin
VCRIDFLQVFATDAGAGAELAAEGGVDAGAELGAEAPGEVEGGFAGRFARLSLDEIGFSQRKAGGSGRASDLGNNMAGEWNGPTIDAVGTPNEIVTNDNTRAAIAQELRIPQIPVKMHLPSEPLPPSMIRRFGGAKTWGEALIDRTCEQRPPLPPGGTMTPPSLPR